MNKIVYDLLLKLEQCDDKHNRCDYLMEHDEITYLLEYTEMLEKRRKQSIKQKEVLDKIKEIVNKTDYNKWELQMTSIEKLMKIHKLLEEIE